MRSRDRICVYGMPGNDGCIGDTEEIEQCNTDACPGIELGDIYLKKQKIQAVVRYACVIY